MRARFFRCAILGVGGLLLAGSAMAQLAITAAMSSASTNNSLGVAQGPNFWELTNFATNGVTGAWVASNGDIGSPGRVIAPLGLEMTTAPQGVRLGWASVPGRTYLLETRNTLTSGGWVFWTNAFASGDHTSVVDGSLSQVRFFRLPTVLPFPSP